MTTKNGKPCSRCGTGVKVSKQLCADCHGRCARCSAPAEVRKADGQYRTYCQPCRRVAEARSTCSLCGEVRDGSHTSYCRSCYRAYSQAWDKANPIKVQAKMRRHDLKRGYGLTVGQWDAMFEAQNGRCAACGAKESGSRRFHVDHCHRTGKIRALLCNRCNVALGMVDDDPIRLRALIAYVEKHAEPTGGTP